VTRFGLFVTVHGNGASGLIPLSSLPDDYWMHDEATQSLVGRRTHRRFALADELSVRLAEATPITGGLIFGLADGVAAPRHSGGELRRQMQPLNHAKRNKPSRTRGGSRSER
jgi:ribonuclease R